MKKINTGWSKLFLFLVLGIGGFCLFTNLFDSTNNLIGYSVLLAAAVWNRIDSRSRAYKVSLHAGPIQADIGVGGDASSGDDPVTTQDEIRPSCEGASPEDSCCRK